MAGRPRKADEVAEGDEIVEKIAWGNIVYNAVTGERIGLLEPEDKEVKQELVEGSPTEELFADKKTDK